MIFRVRGRALYGMLGLTLLLLLLGWWLWRQGGVDVALQPIIENSDYSVSLSGVTPSVTTGVTTSLLFTVKQQGVVSDIYQADRMLHVILASEDRQDFLHTVSVAEQTPGTYLVEHVFTRPGRYRVWVEVDHYAAPERHGAAADLLAYADIEATGQTMPPAMAVATNGRVVTDQGRALTLFTAPTDHGLALSYQATTPAGVPIPLELAEPSIYVIVGPNLEYFRHGHTASPPSATQVVLEEEFAESGEYLFWTEVYPQFETGEDIIEGAFRFPVVGRVVAQ